MPQLITYEQVAALRNDIQKIQSHFFAFENGTYYDMGRREPGEYLSELAEKLEECSKSVRSMVGKAHRAEVKAHREEEKAVKAEAKAHKS